MKHLPRGVRAPIFELKTADGLTCSLEEGLSVGLVVLAFYKSSCPTSQFTLPYFQKIYAEIGAASTTKLWGVSQDDPNETKKFIKEYGLTFDVLIDEHPYHVSSAYGLEYVPTMFIVGRDGIILLSDSGFTKPSLMAVSKVVAEGASRPPIELFTLNDGLPASRPG